MAYSYSGTNNGTQPYFVNNASKVGSMCNYYNAKDFALGKWELNNKWKPDNADGYRFGYGGPITMYGSWTESVGSRVTSRGGGWPSNARVDGVGFGGRDQPRSIPSG